MTVTNKQLSDAINQGIQDSKAQGVPEWLGATDALISLLIENGECFSSGELAAHLRTFRPDLSFSVTSSVGAHVRDRFYGNTFPMYPDGQGGFQPCEMVIRTTGGFTRTPIGTEVCVYGPDQNACLNHPFEVEIPKPGTTVAPAPNDPNNLPAKPVQAPKPVQKAVALQPRAPIVDLVATVHADGRACIPRSALEALLHAANASLKGGDDVHVLVEGNEAIIALDAFTGSRTYSIWASTGRVYFPRPVKPLTPGDAYKIIVDGPRRRLVVDLSKTI